MLVCTKREGLDPSKYGTYYISGKQIELRYANGKVFRQSFKTDGYSELVIDDKRYFTGTADGWERRDTKKNREYRSLNGHYRATSVRLDAKVSDGRKRMERYLKLLQSKEIFVSAEPIKVYEDGVFEYKVAKLSAVLLNTKNDKKYKQDFYLKFGRLERRIVTVTPYVGAIDLGVILEFIKEL